MRGCEEVTLHHYRLLAVDSSMVWDGPGEEVVKGTLHGRVVREGTINGSGNGQVIHVFPVMLTVQEHVVDHDEEA